MTNVSDMRTWYCIRWYDVLSSTFIPATQPALIDEKACHDKRNEKTVIRGSS